VIVNQRLHSNVTNDLIILITYINAVQCRKVHVCDEDDDISVYLLETLITGKYSIYQYMLRCKSLFILYSVDQNQRLFSLKLYLSLAFDLNQPKFASRMLRANPDLPEDVTCSC
jgi:hypothetical protein